MNRELTSKLYLRFPAIFAGRHKSLSESLMGFGFECGDGWFDLLWALCEDLERIAQEEGVRNPEAVQVKEKFGGLRFYVDAATDKMWKRIHDAEEHSYRVCDICGKPGQCLSRRGWLMTRCNEHAPEDTEPCDCSV